MKTIKALVFWFSGRLMTWASKGVTVPGVTVPPEGKVPFLLRNLSLDEAHRIAMKEDPEYKMETDIFWEQVADEYEKAFGTRDFMTGHTERLVSRVNER